MLLGSILFGIGHVGFHLAHRREVCGPKNKKHIVRRILAGIPKVITSVLLIVVIGFFVVAIFGRNINQVTRAAAYKDGINESEYVMLNGQEQYLLMIGHDRSNPVIISLHGGPGAPMTSTDYCWLEYLTDDYTVIGWDQRGCGRTYYHNLETDPDNSTVTFEQAEEDLDALVDYICDRFGQDKVIIMGHSYGSLLGSQDALAKAKEAGDDTTELEAVYEAFINDPSLVNMNAISNITNKYHPVSVTEDVSTAAMMFSPYIGVDDVRWYLLLIRAVTGDGTYERLIGPLEKYLLDGCGHSPQSQLPEEFSQVVKDFLGQ